MGPVKGQGTRPFISQDILQIMFTIVRHIRNTQLKKYRSIWAWSEILKCQQTLGVYIHKLHIKVASLENPNFTFDD